MATTPVKLKEEELKTIENIQIENSEMLAAFGLLYLDKMRINETVKLVTDKEQKLQEQWMVLRKREDSFIDSLIKTYGEGSLDMKNGTFVPLETPPQPPQA